MDIKTSKIFGDYKPGFKTNFKNIYKSEKGLNKRIIEEISKQKNEPKWMLDFRLKAYEIFLKKSLPSWGPNLKNMDLENIYYYIRPQKKIETRWKDIPKKIKDTFDKLGVPEIEKSFLAGTGAQFESEMIYHSMKKNLEKSGIVFIPIEEGLKKYPKLFKKYFGKSVPPSDNKFAALNSAAWSGGSFIYIPKNVHVKLPLHAYFRINSMEMGQFERTLIIADEGSSVHYIEGCSAPIYKKNSLHAAVVEIFVEKNARVHYITIQNWSKNVINLVTKRAFAYKNAEVVWLDFNMGSSLTMKYPAIFLMEEGAKGEIHSLALAKQNQNQDTGAKIIHKAKNTSSKIISKSISKDNGITTYRGLLKIEKGAKNVKSKISCASLSLDKESKTNTYPLIQTDEEDVTIEHEAYISKIEEEKMFYLMSRGINEKDASSLIVNGFAEPIIKKLPMEYAIELLRLLDLEIKESIG